MVGIVTTFLADEPRSALPPTPTAESWLKEAVIRPFAEFLAYRGWVVILLFALLYKYGDALGGSMARPFYVQMGFTGPEIFGVTKSFGVAATILGGLAGGVLVARYGIFKSLLIAGILQAVTNLLFAWQAEGRPRHRRADDRHQRRQLHRRAGRRRLHRLPVEPLHQGHGGHAICAADLADGVRPHRACRPAAAGWRRTPAGPCSGS